MISGPRFINPDGTEIIHRVYSPAPNEHALAVGLLVPFRLKAPDGQSSGSSDTPLWERIKSVLAPDDMFDEGWPKLHGEFLAAGACYPPPGHDSQPVSARISVGAVSKQLAVFGDRHIQVGGRFSRPQPFSRMPLGWAQAYGGASHADNPQGRGIAADADDIIALPNVELPSRLMVSASDRPPAASFAPLPAERPQRARYLGDLGAAWLKARWPHLPQDTDARFFQAAPPDQWHSDYWRGDEAISVLNMHPQFPELQGQLPAWRPRLFAHQIDSHRETHFHELKVGLDTVWLLPEACLGIVIYRAQLPVHMPEARDVGAVLAALEPADTPAEPATHYLPQILMALGAALAQDASPAPLPHATEGLTNLSQSELLERLRAQRQLLQENLAQTGTSDEQLLTMMESEPETRQLAQAIRLNGGTFDGFFSEIETLLRHEEPAAANTPDTAAASLPPAYEPVQPARYAPVAPPAPAPAMLNDAALASRHRRLVIEYMRRGTPCAGLDLSQANLAGLDLSGQDFSGAILTGANFAGATLRETVLTGAHLSDARFDGAQLHGCLLRQAHLHAASFCGAQLQGAVLDDSDCSDADFSDAQLAHTSLCGASCHGAWLKGLVATGLLAQRAQFDHANLEGAELSDAQLDGASFAGANMRGCRLAGASCVGADLSQTDLALADLTGCDLSTSHASEGTSLHRARLDGATLREVSWMGATLDHATLTAAIAEQADLSSCCLHSVVMTAADLKHSCFDHADLSHANLSRANLLSSSFIATRLSNAWLEHTNLYGATFVDNPLDGVRLTGANLDKTALDSRLSR